MKRIRAQPEGQPCSRSASTPGPRWSWRSPGASPKGRGRTRRPRRAGHLAAESDQAKVVLMEEDMTMKDKPVTVDIPLNKALRTRITDAIARYPDATVRLSLLDVRSPVDRKAIHGFNVFLNKPDATASTPVADPH